MIDRLEPPVLIGAGVRESQILSRPQHFTYMGFPPHSLVIATTFQEKCHARRSYRPRS